MLTDGGGAAEDWKQGLPPVAAADARLLILGSLPGDRSLAQSQYYAHPRNQFWDLMESVLGVPLRSLPYADRLDVLRHHQVALWDVIGGAERRGSLDSAMRKIAANPLAEFVASLPDLRAVAFNGRAAFNVGATALNERTDLSLIALPSSSPAHAVGFERKLVEWLKLKEAMRQNCSYALAWSPITARSGIPAKAGMPRTKTIT